MGRVKERKCRLRREARVNTARLGGVILIIACLLCGVSRAHAKVVAPCMKDGKPCTAPGPWTPGNLNLPLPFGIHYNSMSSSRTTAAGQRPGGFFGPSMSFPLGYIQVEAGVPYSFLPDGMEIAFKAKGQLFESEYVSLGDLTALSPRPRGGGYDMVRADGTRVAFTAAMGGNRFYPTEVKDLEGHTLFSIAYNDPSGALILVTDPDGFVTKFLPLASDRTKVGQIQEPDGTTATLSYNPQGQLSRIEFAGQTTDLTYDASGNLTRFRVQTGLNTDTINYFYRDGLLSDVMDGQNNSRSYVYGRDSLTVIEGSAGTIRGFSRTVYTNVGGRQMMARQETGQGDGSQPGAVVWSATYNARGLPTSYTDEMGRVTRLEYGTAPYPTRVTNPDGSSDTFTYSDAANSYRVTNVVSTGPDGKQSSEMLSWSGAKLASRTRTVDGTIVLTERYASSATSQSVTTTSTETYSYDAAGRIVSMKGPGGRTSMTVTNGQVTSVSDNGVRYGISNTLSDTGERTVGISGGGIAASFSSSLTGRSREMSIGNSDASFLLSSSSSESGSVTSSNRNSSYSVLSGPVMKSGSSSSATTVDAQGNARTTGQTR